MTMSNDITHSAHARPTCTCPFCCTACSTVVHFFAYLAVQIQIVQTDIVYDSGYSLNYALDCGQVEVRGQSFLLVLGRLAATVAACSVLIRYCFSFYISVSYIRAPSCKV